MTVTIIFKNSYSYDAFGNITSSKEQIVNRYSYASEQYDPISGHYYLRARYYSPSVGRFIGEDSFRGDELNLYAYVKNNPVNYIDSTGYSSKEVSNSSIMYGGLDCSKPIYVNLVYGTKTNNPNSGWPELEIFRSNINGNQAVLSILLNIVAGDVYDLELIIIGYDFEENRWASWGERGAYLAFAVVPGSAKVMKEIGEEVAEKIIKETTGELFEKAAKETGEEILEKGVKEASEVITELSRAQKRNLESLDNVINNNLKEHDFSGTLRDLQGNPVPKPDGGYWNYLEEMKNSYKSLHKIKRGLEGSLKNPNLNNYWMDCKKQIIILIE